MAVTSRTMSGLDAAAVFAALSDGACYGHWVVGTRKIRSVDAGWPAPGTCLHYTVGYFPLRKDGHTRSLEHAPGTRLVLQANAWPVGSARIALTVDEAPDGVVVHIDEVPDSGPGKLLHNPLADLAIKLRNVESLRRLEQQARQH